jgi:hypothetical protein
MSNRRGEFLSRSAVEWGLESQGLPPEQLYQAAKHDERGRKARLQALAWYDEKELRPLEREMEEVKRELAEATPGSESHKQLLAAYNCLMDGWRAKCKQRERAGNEALASGRFAPPGHVEVSPDRVEREYPVFNAETGILTFNGKRLSLSRGEKYVLTILVEKTAAGFAELQNAHPRPDKVVEGLRTKFPMLKKFIFRPGGPGKGGYSTTIRPSETE